MLELRPSCERCECALPPSSHEAMICTFECTYCRDCVTGPLQEVCPNCGGGFEKRPVRPDQNFKGGNFLGNYPAGTRVVHKPFDPVVHQALVAKVRAANK